MRRCRAFQHGCVIESLVTDMLIIRCRNTLIIDIPYGLLPFECGGHDWLVIVLYRRANWLSWRLREPLRISSTTLPFSKQE